MSSAAGDPDALVLHACGRAAAAARRRAPDGRSGACAGRPTSSSAAVAPSRVQHVEGVADEGEPLVRGADPAGVLAVVVDQRSRARRAAACRRPSARRAARRRSSRCRRGSRLPPRPGGGCSRWVRSGSTSRAAARRSSSAMRGDGLADVLALLGLGQLVMLDPAPAMGADVVAGGADRGRGLGIALQRQARSRRSVIGRPRSWNSRISRQKPTRLPYSNMPSAARSRPWIDLAQAVRLGQAGLGEALAVLHRRARSLPRSSSRN